MYICALVVDGNITVESKQNIKKIRIRETLNLLTNVDSSTIQIYIYIFFVGPKQKIVAVQTQFFGGAKNKF